MTSGKKILEFDPAIDAKEEILAKVSGRTGNLRAPALLVKDTYYVGYNDELYDKLKSM